MREGLSGEALGGALDAGGERLDTGLVEVARVLARDRERLLGRHRARYGRSAVRASKTSATARARAPTGRSPARTPRW